MSVVHGQDSEYAKEMRRWNAHHSEFGPPGRPYTYQPFPARLYKAGRKDGRPAILDARTAHDEREQRKYEAEGFVAGGQQAALDALTAQEQEFATLAAERNFEVRRMSDGARAEVAAHESAAGAQHLPTIPETPIRRRGGRPKNTASA